MKKIHPNHYTEWLSSKIDPSIIELNLKSWGNPYDLKPGELDPFDLFLYSEQLDRRNDGRVANWLLKSYDFLTQGGWWVGTLNPITGLESLWGQGKPNQPRVFQEIKSPGQPPKLKTRKYEAPPKVPTEAIFLKIPAPIAVKIAAQAKLEASWLEASAKGISFWEWVKNTPAVQILITEGAKKAGALLSAGYCAIALPGIYNGYRSKDSHGNPLSHPRLIPQLECFTGDKGTRGQGDKGFNPKAPGGKPKGKNPITKREFIFCFDADTKPDTIANVRKATLRTGNLLEKAGCTVSVINWDSSLGKGVDDLIVNHGTRTFERSFKKRISLAYYQILDILSLDKYDPIKINQRYLDSSLLEDFKDQRLIGLKSPKNTGKSSLLKQICQLVHGKNQKVLVITHRIQLAKALCEIFGIDHIEEIKVGTQGALGYGLCIDSLHSRSAARFNPQEWIGATIILDECEQILQHLLTSTTEVKNHRVSVIENLREVLRVVGLGVEIDEEVITGQIFVSDADLSAISLDYLTDLIGEIPTQIIENTFQPYLGKRQAFIFPGNDPRLFYNDLIKAIKNGERPYIFTGGQQELSTWGTITLEKDLKQRFPNKRILVIDAETIADPQHPAFGITTQLNSLKNWDIVLVSPVLETGVSIEIMGHFTSVWGLCWGNLPVNNFCQATERIREDIPRYLWVKQKGINRIGNGSTSPYVLRKSSDQQSTAIKSQLSSLYDEWEEKPLTESLEAWSKWGAVTNLDMNHYRERVIEKMAADGYELILIEPSVSEYEEAVNLKKKVKELRDKNYEQGCEKISQAETPTDNELEDLKRKKVKTKAERIKERKGILVSRYGVTVTPELVKKDDQGWYSKLRNYYYFTVGKEFLSDRDLAVIRGYLERGETTIFDPDLNRDYLGLRLALASILKLEQFIGKDKEFTKKSLRPWHQFILKYRRDIYYLLGIQVPEKSPIAAANAFLEKLFGIRLTAPRRRRDEQGKAEWVYSGADPNFDERDEVLTVWYQRDSQRACSSPDPVLGSEEDLYLEKMDQEGLTSSPDPVLGNEGDLYLEKIDQAQQTSEQPTTSPSSEVERQKAGGRGQEADQGFQWEDIIADLNHHLQRIGWTIEKGTQYLLSKYGVSSRKRLTHAQLIEFWNFLKMAV